MGSGTFFSKVAAADPLAHALNLPGANKYQETRPVEVGPNSGAYTGVNPTLAGANAGYRAGGPGAMPGAVNAPIAYGAMGQGYGSVGSGIFGNMNRFANLSANTNPASGGNLGVVPRVSTNVYGGG
jgi:hypothetical protein